VNPLRVIEHNPFVRKSLAPPASRGLRGFPSSALARLLPGVRAQYPRPVYEAIVRFVIEKGRLDPGARRALEDSLASGDA
jgi:hypothetical protein